MNDAQEKIFIFLQIRAGGNGGYRKKDEHTLLVFYFVERNDISPSLFPLPISQILLSSQTPKALKHWCLI